MTATKILLLWQIHLINLYFRNFQFLWSNKHSCVLSMCFRWRKNISWISRIIPDRRSSWDRERSGRVLRDFFPPAKPWESSEAYRRLRTRESRTLVRARYNSRLAWRRSGEARGSSWLWALERDRVSPARSHSPSKFLQRLSTDLFSRRCRVPRSSKLVRSNPPRGYRRPVNSDKT